MKFHSTQIYRPELILEVRKKPSNKDKKMEEIFKILDSINTGRVIVYNATCGA